MLDDDQSDGEYLLYVPPLDADICPTGGNLRVGLLVAADVFM